MTQPLAPGADDIQVVLPDWLGLASQAAVLGGCAWLELRLFEVAGGWVATEPDPVTRNVLAVQSREHAERAGELRSRLPATHDLRPADVLVAADAGLAAAVAGVAEAGGSIERVAGIERLTALLVATYDTHAASCSPVADGPYRRTVLRLAAESRQSQAALLVERTRLSAGEGAAERLEAWVRRLADLIAATGGPAAAAR